jgi:hypothetical protein
METLREAYTLAKENDGAPGVDGVTFEAIEKQGVEAFLERRADVACTANAAANRFTAWTHRPLRQARGSQRLP